MQQLKFFLRLSLVALMTISCGGSDSSAPATNDPQTQSALNQNTKAAQRGTLPSNAVYSYSVSFLYLCAEAVFTANIVANPFNQMITTGSLQQTSSNYVYTATPNDRLHVSFINGTEFDLIIGAMQGLLTGNSAFFVDNDHQFECQIIIGKVIDLALVSNRFNGNSSGSIKGQFTSGETKYTVDLTQVGSYQSNQTVDSFRYIADDMLSGSITAPDFSLTVSENIKLENTIGPASTDFVHDRSINNVWTQQDKSYSYQGQIVKHFRNSFPFDVQTGWVADGQVKRANQTIGQLAIRQVNDNDDIEISIISDETSFALERYAINPPSNSNNSANTGYHSSNTFGYLGSDGACSYYLDPDSGASVMTGNC